MPARPPFARPLYAHADLRRLIDPASIAVIGASPRPQSFGDRILANLAGYDGAVYPVNAKYERIGAHAAYPSVGALPAPADCAIIVAGREAVEPLVLDCARAGVGGVIVCASGYAEVGTPERIAQQQRLAAIAGEYRLPIVGPNCIGIFAAARQAATTFMTILPRPQPGKFAIGIVSQSGALGFALAQAAARGVAISHVLTSGNSCDVDAADYVAYLAADPGCAAIACVFEGMAEPRRMMAAARLARQAGKPLVVFKMASGTEGAAAALSHTGSLAGSQAAYEAAFRAEGAVLVEQFEHLIETAVFFAKAGTPRAPGVAILATSGGNAIMAADRAEQYRVALPQPSAEVREVLLRHIPEFGSARNPCDVTAQVLNDPGSLDACANALLQQPDYAALVIPQSYAYAPVAARMPGYAAVAAAADKPVVLVWATEHLAGPGYAEAEAEPRVAIFRSMSGCFAALAAWQARAQASPAAAPDTDPAPRDAAARLLDAAEGSVLTERAAKAVLATYGIPVVAERFVTDAAEAVAAATAIGFPVVLKGESPDLPHKTEAGLVHLDLRDAAAVTAAWHAISERAAAASARLTGAVVQPMIPRGVELMIGARNDPMFGPLVLVGFGGTLVEVMQDSVLAPAPVSVAAAASMLGRLRGQRLLDGFRDLPAVDRAGLAAVISAVSRFIADHPDRVAELDLNPLIVSGLAIVAVDALLVRPAQPLR
jgi:acetyl-CoA synthetase